MATIGEWLLYNNGFFVYTSLYEAMAPPIRDLEEQFQKTAIYIAAQHFPGWMNMHELCFSDFYVHLQTTSRGYYSGVVIQHLLKCGYYSRVATNRKRHLHDHIMYTITSGLTLEGE